MNKPLITILQLILISSSIFAQANSDPLEQDFITKKQQYEKAQQDLNKRYGEVLNTLHKQVSESKLRPNPELLRKIEAEAAVLNVNLPSQWYLGDWQIYVLGKESFQMRITLQGWQILKNGKALGEMKSYKIEDGTLITSMLAYQAVISKGDSIGQKIRILYSSEPNDKNVEDWTGVKMK
jgi:hypothetical protein